jgi:hypothetical protein
MPKPIIRQKISCVMAVITLFWLPVLFMACSGDTRSPASHAGLDNNLQETSLEKEVRTLMEKGISLEERKQQVPIIKQAFARLTTPERARNLAALCYLKTLGTPFSPLDLAEIALAETGGHRLSSKATSSMGAMGVWQLMPREARNHGYSPSEMRNDEKCAEAAVRTLLNKLVMADGNMDKAKKFYCGTGPQAEAYLRKIRSIRSSLMAEIKRSNAQLAMNPKDSAVQ